MLKKIGEVVKIIKTVLSEQAPVKEPKAEKPAKEKTDETK
jgi:hypothetical protein